MIDEGITTTKAVESQLFFHSFMYFYCLFRNLFSGIQNWVCVHLERELFHLIVILITNCLIKKITIKELIVLVLTQFWNLVTRVCVTIATQLQNSPYVPQSEQVGMLQWESWRRDLAWIFIFDVIKWILYCLGSFICMRFWLSKFLVH